MKRILIAVAALVAVIALPLSAGEWHANATNLCSDCHTMHFSQSHNWDGTTPVSTTPQSGGNWLGATGPNAKLLKLPANQLCMSCHDGQTFAPDVVETNTNASPTMGRMAGALNLTGTAPYEIYKGHTLGSTTPPPGFNTAYLTAAGVTGESVYNAAEGLECISCHLQHGSAAVYRNLGPRVAAFQPSYKLDTTNDTTKDVWINIPTGYVANTGVAANFNPLFDFANITYNRNDATVGTVKTSNKLDTFCSGCHGDFHGGSGDVTIGGGGAALSGFIRHPTSQVAIGASAALGNGGTSSLSGYVANVAKTKVYASDRVGFTDATPGCVSCHKAHGNQNPFGLVFLAANATTVDEQGGWGATQSHTQMTGYRNMCGQCHGQGSKGTTN